MCGIERCFVDIMLCGGIHILVWLDTWNACLMVVVGIYVTWCKVDLVLLLFQSNVIETSVRAKQADLVLIDLLQVKALRILECINLV